MRKMRGFTLIELLLSLSLIAIILLVLGTLFFVMFSARVKNQTLSEVEQQGASAMQYMTQIIRNANAISSPAAGTSGSSLTLSVPTAAKSPTIFDLSAGVLRIKEGTGSAIILTNTRVTVSALTFTNLTVPGSTGSARIQFRVTAVNASGRNEYDFTKIVTASASIRR